MKRSITYISILILFIGTLLSCKQVIDLKPESAITADGSLKNESAAQAAIIGCYDGVQDLPRSLLLWGEARADVYGPSDLSITETLQLINGNVNADISLSAWGSVYTTINRVNNVLKYVPAIPDFAAKERILGEAYFLRALLYFYLVRTFENVPLLTAPYYSTTQNYFPKQATPAEVYALVLSDLLAAESRVPDTYAALTDTRGRATKGAVRALLADYYMWKKQYQETLDITDKIVTGTPANYTLVAGADYGSIFLAKNTTESIFELQFSNGNNENGNTVVSFFLPIGQTSPTSYPGGSWLVCPSEKLKAAFEPGDLRKSATYTNTGSPSAPWRDVNKDYGTKYLGTLIGSQRYFDSNYILYRLADIILLRAEAYNELTQTNNAITELNKIRTRAGLNGTTAATQADVRVAIENERLKELAFEGKRYFDLVRSGRYATVTGNTNPDWVRWPIASSELLINTNLVQNHGY
ncbi:RagB/SusD domain-containing protein [Chitinophaga niastensis]|uniref:RagB/SusD domain-containing protein n=1 Tax=Chitinophaga niastensis TaxID=536980 RepID=A0A2P8HCF2_CHINA|nr:RagB/SusD family nutrient uptake outer membrane protein [Chitinophaga niastensis]PSL43917.1 RagB/SusD domain-containing protein [Chitinophaga niastensis]